MHQETFEIWIFMTDIPDNYFPVDELIALPIQVLNRKGYITAACCAGHLFPALYGNYVENHKHITIEDGTVLRIFDTEDVHESYIMFKEGIVLQTLPTGFEKDDDNFSTRMTIRKPHSGNDTYKLVGDIVESMTQLREWALNLLDLMN